MNKIESIEVWENLNPRITKEDLFYALVEKKLEMSNIIKEVISGLLISAMPISAILDFEPESSLERILGPLEIYSDIPPRYGSYNFMYWVTPKKGIGSLIRYIWNNKDIRARVLQKSIPTFKHPKNLLTARNPQKLLIVKEYVIFELEGLLDAYSYSLSKKSSLSLNKETLISEGTTTILSGIFDREILAYTQIEMAFGSRFHQVNLDSQVKDVTRLDTADELTTSYSIDTDLFKKLLNLSNPFLDTDHVHVYPSKTKSTYQNHLTEKIKIEDAGNISIAKSVSNKVKKIFASSDKESQVIYLALKLNKLDSNVNKAIDYLITAKFTKYPNNHGIIATAISGLESLFTSPANLESRYIKKELATKLSEVLSKHHFFDIKEVSENVLILYDLRTNYVHGLDRRYEKSPRLQLKGAGKQPAEAVALLYLSLTIKQEIISQYSNLVS